MEAERPPEIDADYRVIHGPWPRWVLQFSLLKLALWTAGIVVALCLLALLIAVAVTR
ncbi:hypothetical protein [Phenylobacterium sp.]|uniref:hypothetical protein n=1 Tax=Phenylobacterium sp. TaxID=1871053 RepID=UPI00374D89FD